MSSRRTFLTIAMIGMALVGLGMTLCGGVFTAGALWDTVTRHGRGGENYTGAVYLISVPSLLIGLVFVRLAWRMTRRIDDDARRGSGPTA